MARIPLEIGEWGKIKRFDTPHGPAARANFRDGRGVRIPVQRRGDTPASAERALVKALKAMAKAALGDGAVTPESFLQEVADYYFDDLIASGAKDGTITTYRSTYDRHIKAPLGNVRMRQLTVGRLEQVIQTHREKPSTAKSIRVVLVNLLDIAVRHDALRINLAANTRPITPPRKKVTALQPERVKAMISLFELSSSVNNRDMDVPLKLLAVTGCRTGELLATRWEDIDFENSVLRVTGTIVQDAKTRELKRQDEGKTLAAERGLTLPKSVVDLLRERYRVSEEDAVFPARGGGYQWPNNFRRKWRDVIKDTAFEGTTPRDFRKAVATYLDRQVGSKAAQQQLGHESDQITTAFYIEREDEIADFSAHLENLLK